MKILHKSSHVRSAIRVLLDDKSDQRVVAVAFVGADAKSFLSAPAGLTIYCWPRPGGTNPYAIEELLHAGTTVRFVERLHAKIYWSRMRGCLIGSANLTANALGEGGLQEAVVSLQPRVFDIQPFIDSLQVLPDEEFPAKLRWLHIEHVKFMADNGHRIRDASRRTRVALPSFQQWQSGGDGRADWRLGWWQDWLEPPEDALTALADETGSKRWATFLAVERSNDLMAGVFTLSFRVREVSGRRVKLSDYEWWAPETLVRSKDKQWRESPYVWFGRRRVPHGTRPPFDHSKPQFRRALEAAIESRGGIGWLSKAPLKPAKSFIEDLRRLNHGG